MKMYYDKGTTDYKPKTGRHKSVCTEALKEVMEERINKDNEVLQGVQSARVHDGW